MPAQQILTAVAPGELALIHVQTWQHIIDAETGFAVPDFARNRDGSRMSLAEWDVWLDRSTQVHRELQALADEMKCDPDDLPRMVAGLAQAVIAMMHDLHPTAEVVAVSEVRQGGLDE